MHSRHPHLPNIGNFRENMLRVFVRHGETVVGTLQAAADSGAPLDLQVVIDV